MHDVHTTDSGTPASPVKPDAITPVEYGGLQAAYDHFNVELFDATLPDVLLTLQRHANSRGYFRAREFAHRDGKERSHELALNPDGFIGRSDEEILSTLAHEMTHVWEEEGGTAPKRAYHNKVWAAKMKSIGLQPSSTGMVGGRETGARMTHYIMPGGRFDRAYEQLQARGWKLNLQSAPRPNAATARSSKTKFTCPACGLNVWGKPDAQVDCHGCQQLMLAEALQSLDRAAA
jgi:hypothetical protein